MVSYLYFVQNHAASQTESQHFSKLVIRNKLIKERLEKTASQWEDRLFGIDMVWVYPPGLFSVISSKVWQLTSTRYSYSSPFNPISLQHIVILSYFFPGFTHHQDVWMLEDVNTLCTVTFGEHSLTRHLNSSIYVIVSVLRWLAWERPCASKVLTEQQTAA